MSHKQARKEVRALFTVVCFVLVHAAILLYRIYKDYF